ncbi:MAG TPA: N-formylglutamate amidohydrolase, partial [Stellaceae bacterium]
MREIYDFRPGRIPLLVSMPHVGTELPADIAARLTGEARALPDTDWHLPLLYDFLDGIGASVIVARVSRYVIDLNRPPDDTPLYASATTGLCPSVLFDGRKLYRPGAEPDDAERRARLETHWRPYHQRLEAELTAMRQRYGVAV